MQTTGSEKPDLKLTLADRRHFGLDAGRWEAFMVALEAPSRDMPRAERLMREPSVFEGGER